MSRLDGTPWMSATVRLERPALDVRFRGEDAAAAWGCCVAVPFETGLPATVETGLPVTVRGWLGFDGLASGLAVRAPAAAVVRVPPVAVRAPALPAVVRVLALVGRVAPRALPVAAVFFFAALVVDFFAAPALDVRLLAGRFFAAGFFAAAAFLVFVAAFFFAPCFRVAGRAAGVAVLRAAFFTDVLAGLAAGRAAFFLAMAVPFGSLTVGAN